jgi:hypothetical protein
VSDGFLVGSGTSEERKMDWQRVVDAATRSGAVLYALDSRGLTTNADASSAANSDNPGLKVRVDRSSEQVMRTTLHTLSDQTGGFVVHGTNDMANGLKRMLDDNDAYYVLAYQPTNTKRDGRFRKIEVRVAGHENYRVRTRKGYLAPDDKKPAAAPPALLQEADARALLDKLPSPGEVVRLNADYVDLPPNGPQALLRARVDLNGVAWEKAGARKRASIQLVGGVYDADGQAVGAPFTRPWELDLDAGEYKRAATEGLRYQQSLPLTPGRYQFRLVARDAKGSVLGGASEWIDIADLKQKKLTLSSVFLSSSASEIGTDAAAGARRFKRGDSLYFALYVYNPTSNDKGATDVVLQAQLSAADKMVAASKPQPVTFQEKDGAPVPQSNGMSLEGLPPGPYQLKVVVVDKVASATAFRKIDFTLE